MDTALYIVLASWIHITQAQISSHAGFHLFGGTFQSGLSSQPACLQGCTTSATCRALDFNSDDNSCWFHTDSSVCNVLNPKSSCTHYKLAICEKNRHVSGATFQPDVITVTSCINTCKSSASCQGVDFNFGDNACWFHSASECGPLIIKSLCNHYRLVSCTTNSQQQTPAPAIVPVSAVSTTLPGVHVIGGTLIQAYRDIAACSAACIRATVAVCQAVDFDDNGNTCWFHGGATACGQQQELATSIHVKTALCALPVPVPVPAPVAVPVPVPIPAPVPVPAPVPAPVPVPVDNRPILSVSVMQQIQGGTRQAGLTTQTDCINSCTGQCVAADFNRRDNSCWFHTVNTACNVMNSAPLNIHYKKTQCASGLVHGQPPIRPRLNPRIVGGETAVPHSWPWQVGLSANGQRSFTCGGSLLNEEWIMTAAHCTQGSFSNPAVWTVRIGDHDTFTEEPSQINAQVQRVIRHPQYAGFNNDVALMKLSSRVTLSAEVGFSCLPSGPITFLDGMECVVTGWGLTTEGGTTPRQLNQVRVPVVSQAQCRGFYGAGITNQMICAGLTQGGRDACQGDSGGPLVCQIGGIWYQAGIVSFGQGCAQPQSPGVYARVSEFTEWIQDTIANN